MACASQLRAISGARLRFVRHRLGTVGERFRVQPTLLRHLDLAHRARLPAPVGIAFILDELIEPVSSGGTACILWRGLSASGCNANHAGHRYPPPGRAILDHCAERGICHRVPEFRAQPLRRHAEHIRDRVDVFGLMLRDQGRDARQCQFFEVLPLDDYSRITSICWLALRRMRATICTYSCIPCRDLGVGRRRP